MDSVPMDGEVEVGETYVGGKRRNMHASKRPEGRGPVGKTVVIGAKQRSGKVVAEPIDNTGHRALQGFVGKHAAATATVYTDDHAGYSGIPQQHETVKHSVSEYVSGQAHTNGIESFWASLKRGYHGVYHHMSAKHLDRYVAEFSGRHNDRTENTADQMRRMVRGMGGKRLRYIDLTAEDGKPA